VTESDSEPGGRSPVGLIFGALLVLGLAGYALMRFLRRKS
jgi:MYXO-CTERM domain-containing protein